MRLALATLALVVAATACASEGSQRPPEAAADGLQLTGRLGGQRVSVSDGEPSVTYGDCDPQDGPDVDLCIESHTIDGAPLGLIIENPAALEPGVVIEPIGARTEDCTDGCDELTGRVVVRLRLGERRTQATFGRVDVTKAGERFAATFVLEFDDDTINGGFDVRPPSTP